ncbi:MAG TPA: carboxypeptidase regulatory-like domain-containing protein, partial [Thermoanaerobaculia bacterium]|nr:carboxypeptidase regulatory-like domain-containing protein [Thermoanaerobaculia bacterium]
AGANVFITYGTFEYFVKTDEQGRYEAPDPKHMRSIAVVHPDFAIHDEMLWSMSGVSASALNRTLVAGSTLPGRVITGEQDTPVAKATIVVDGWPLATSADDGTFTIARISPKWKAIVARKDSLLGQRSVSKEKSATIRVSKAATISGRIIDAKSRVPVNGAVVTLSTRRFGPASAPVGSTLTDAKGAYSLVAPAGTYVLVPGHPGYAEKMADVSAVTGQSTSKDVTLTALARVSGVVVDESKKPVVVATIDSENAETARFPMPRALRGITETIVSGPDGRFSIRVSSEEQIWVRAVKRGLPPVKSEAFHLAAGERRTNLMLTIPSGIAVSGRAIDAQGDPLSGVAVTAMEVESGQRGMMVMRFMGTPGTDDDAVQTASDGTFTMRVKEGTYDFLFKREGLAPKLVRGQNVTVSSSPNVEATMEPAVEITGRVSRGGVGIENVSVFAMMQGGSPSNAMTGPDGSFTLSGLAPGSVRLMARKEDDFVQEQRNVTAPARDVLIEIAPGGRVSGRVIEKGSGKPITSFQAGISTSRQGGGMAMMMPPQLRSFTSDDGSFTLESVPVGANVLVASAPGYASSRLNVTIEAGREMEGLELQLDAGVKLVGRVTGSNGSPLSDVDVRVLPSATGGFAMTGMDRTATTDANGEYVIEAIEAGEENVSFQHAKHATVRKPVTLKGRETRLDVQLASGGRVTGSVVTEAGAPVADAQVEAYSPSGSESARTNASGTFEFDSVSPGRYRFSANKTGYAEGTIDDVDVSSGTPVRIVLKTGGSIYGRIIGLTAQELSQTQVNAFGSSSSAQGTVDASGNYRIEGVASGTLQVGAYSGAGVSGASKRSAAQTVELAPGGSQQLDITFRNDIEITGRVTRNGTPVTGGFVSFIARGNSRGGGTAPTDNDGQYSVTGLEDGEYSVMVNDSMRTSPYTTTYQVTGSSTFDIDYRTNALRGRVLDVSSNEPLANAAIQLRATGQTEGPRMTRSAVSDATGAFIVDGVPPGSYVVTASKEGFANDVKDVYVSDSGAEPLEMRMAKNVGVTLNVVDARDGRAISARAYVYDMQGRLVDETRVMFGGGADSSALTLNVAPGMYSATVSASGYGSRNIALQSPSSQTVTLSPGGTLLIRSKHNSAMRIRLLDSNGLPYWRFSNAQTSRELVPNPGTTTFNNITGGVYTIQLLDGEVVVNSKQVMVAEGQVSTEEI